MVLTGAQMEPLPTPHTPMKVVLVLSGGGAKALAHAGAFRALEQASLIPTHIVATSMGAVVGAALGAGMPFDQVRRRAMGIRRKDVAPFDPLILVMGLFARSLFPASALRRAIACIVPRTQFEYLRIPLTVTATDLDSGELLLLGGPERRGSELDRPGRDIELADALYASCALPLYFPPLEADGRRLGDGGLRAVLPLVQRARSSRTPTCLSPSMLVRASTSAADPLPTAISRNHPTLPFPRASRVSCGRTARRCAS